MSTVDDLKADYPAFAGLDDAVISRAIERAAVELSAPTWGRLYPFALVALAAHMLELRARSAAAAGSGGASVAPGPVTSWRTGDWAESYAAPARGRSSSGQADDILAGTQGGAEYLRLRARLYIGPRTGL